MYRTVYYTRQRDSGYRYGMTLHDMGNSEVPVLLFCFLAVYIIVLQRPHLYRRRSGRREAFALPGNYELHRDRREAYLCPLFTFTYLDDILFS